MATTSSSANQAAPAAAAGGACGTTPAGAAPASGSAPASSIPQSLDGAVLRLRQYRGEACVMPLYPLGELDGDALSLQAGSVMQTARYEVELLFPRGLAPAWSRFCLVVNGEDFSYAREGLDCPLQALIGDRVYEGFRLKPAKGTDRIFCTIYGFARLELAFEDEDGRRYDPHRTHDIVCLQPDKVCTEDVEAILSCLTEDPSNDRALQWMMADGTLSAGDFSLVSGGYKKGRDRSVGTYLRLVEEGLDAVERALPSLRSHAASKMRPQPRVVDTAEVRRFGAREAMWLAANPQVMQPAASKAGLHRTAGLVPQRVATYEMRSDFDIYENQVILGFVNGIVVALSDFQARLDSSEDICAPVARGSAASSAAGGEPYSFLLVAMRILQRRLRRYGQRAEALRRRAIRIKGLLTRLMPGVRALDLRRTPLRKTKIFKGLQAYSQLYAHIERFVRFGEDPFIADGLAMSILRLDRLYEMYALRCLLNGLRGLGFELAGEPSGHAAAYAGAYEDEGRHPRGASPVSNVYELERGDVRALLLYEPSVYADARELNGCTLHRLYARGEHYLPDYVLIVETPSERRVFILDAKYSKRSSLLVNFDGEDGSSRWESCVGKYLRDMVDGRTGRLPDALWLISGIRDEAAPVVTAAARPWGGAGARFASGVFDLVPGADVALLLGAMGLDADSLNRGELGDGSAFLAEREGSATAWEKGSSLFAASIPEPAVDAGSRRTPAPAELAAATSAPAAATAVADGEVGIEAGAGNASEKTPSPPASTRPNANAGAQGTASAHAGEITEDEPEHSSAIPTAAEASDGTETGTASASEENSPSPAESHTAPAYEGEAPSRRMPPEPADTAATGIQEPAPAPAPVSAAAGGDAALPAVGAGMSKRAQRNRERKERQREERQLKKAQRKRKQEKAEAKREASLEARRRQAEAAGAASKGTTAKSPTTQDALAPTVARIIELAGEQGFEDLLDARHCLIEVNIDKPLLRKSKAKGYRPIEAHGEELFYYASRRADHKPKLERYLKKLESRKDRE